MNTQAQAHSFSIEDWPQLEPVYDPSLIILLDLNNTLVSDGPTFRKPGKNYGEQILHENYRLGLVELLKGHTVLLYTVRKAEHRLVTLDNIAKKCNGWQPHEAFFNGAEGSTGTTVKGAYLKKLIFPRYGMPPQQKYYAIESDGAVRAMLGKRYDIPTDRVEEPFNWTRLPYYDDSTDNG